jgi:MoaA/NifB/PqqE/SkfB family radical SAM enzyme
MVITYYPWSEEVLHECLTSYDLGEMPTLDLELTAKCTQASCIYCDSRPEVGARHPNELNFRETDKLLKDGKKLGLRWIYTCGLGEPLEDARLERLVESASALGIRLSMFTNGILIHEQKAKWLHDNGVCLILKFDTREESTFDRILGKGGAAAKIYGAVELLLKAGYTKGCGDGFTDLAFSIVPTSLNVSHIEDVIQYAKDNNIFPSIGELEQAGRVFEKQAYGALALSRETISSLKILAERILWKGYTRPICPAIITGVHIDNVGNCVVDSETGLNCKWFLLQEPLVKVIGNVRKNELHMLLDDVRSYRRSRFSMNGNGVRSCESMEFAFGGCGGSPRRIIQLARQHL